MENQMNAEKTKKLKHVRVYNQLYRMISDGIFASGSQLPSEPDLAEQLHVSRMTLRRALALLQEDHLVKNIRGKGNFICDGGTSSDYCGMEILQHPVYHCCLQSIDQVESELRIEPPTESICQTLNQKPAAVVISDRWYHSREKAIAYSLSFIPIDIISEYGIDLGKPEELKNFLEKSVYVFAASSSCTFSYTKTGNFTAIKYILSQSSSFLLIQENIYDNAGKIIISNKHYIPVELFEMHMETKI